MFSSKSGSALRAGTGSLGWVMQAYHECIMRVHLLASTLCLLVGFHATAQQPKPFAFRDLRLGMTLSEFHKMHPSGSDSVSDLSTASLTRHLTQANCGRGTGETKMSGNENVGVIRCGYKVPLEKVVSLLHVSAYSVSTMFLNGKLAVVEIQPPMNTDMCFERPPEPTSDRFPMFLSACDRFRELMQNVKDSVAAVGPVKTVTDNRYQLPLLRWDNGSSVAELQATQCGPWNSTDSGWGQAISEVLAGSYCGPRDSASSSLTMILYVHRELGSALAEQLAK
jgi:hypothetical protein